MNRVRSYMYLLIRLLSLCWSFKSVFLYAGAGGTLYFTAIKAKSYITKKIETKKRAQLLEKAVEDYHMESSYIEQTSSLEKRAQELEKKLKLMSQ